MPNGGAKRSNILKAGAAYFSMVFAAGFALGAIRTLLLVPRIGELNSVALELPLMLVVSWYACGRALRRYPVPAGAASHAATGAFAFALLLIAELVLTVTAFGGTLATFATELATAHGALGLAGQIAFALFPVLRRAR
jgi:hypothetical protein